MDDEDPNLPVATIRAADVVAHWKRLTTISAEQLSRALDALHEGEEDLDRALDDAATIKVPSGGMTLRGRPPVAPTNIRTAPLDDTPEVTLAFALLDTGDRTDEGQLILAVTPVWDRIIADLARDPHALHQLTPRQFEELIAGGWRARDWQVTLTPRSGDGGVDIIATRSDIAIRILDQAKLYKPGHRVTAEEVRAMWGVLDADRRASKAYVSTTSVFAPRAYQEFADRMPTRIELRDGAALIDWLTRYDRRG